MVDVGRGRDQISHNDLEWAFDVIVPADVDDDKNIDG